MHLLALIIGLGLERLLTHLFHLREFRWLDPVFSRALAVLRGLSLPLAVAGAVAVLALLVLPVALLFATTLDILVHVPYFIFSVIVLMFCLGPRDLQEEVADYCLAAERGDGDRLDSVTLELLEQIPSGERGSETAPVEQAVFIQANNRMFGVVFWFVVLGPAGAWMFRVADLMRRHAHYAAVRSTDESPDTDLGYRAASIVHSVLAWVPGRLLAVGYALAGNFDKAAEAWRSYRQEVTASALGLGDDFLGWVGSGALGGPGDSGSSVRVRSAMQLVTRTLWFIWCPVVALLTMYNWLA